jgi:hypothetical protein
MSTCQYFYCSNIEEACLTQVFPLALLLSLLSMNEKSFLLINDEI